jgi:hypothetical protein
MGADTASAVPTDILSPAAGSCQLHSLPSRIHGKRRNRRCCSQQTGGKNSHHTRLCDQSFSIPQTACRIIMRTAFHWPLFLCICANENSKKRKKEKKVGQCRGGSGKKYKVEKVGRRTASRVLLISAILECTRLPLAPAPSGSSFL